jgi:hypothetical protein
MQLDTKETPRRNNATLKCMPIAACVEPIVTPRKSTAEIGGKADE